MSDTMWTVRYHDRNADPTTQIYVMGNRASYREFPTREEADAFWAAHIAAGGLCFDIEVPASEYKIENPYA